jgi:large subunit ribosomal protein L21
MYALVKINGKQYKAQQGELLKVDRLPEGEGEQLEFDSVLMLKNDGNVQVGAPFVSGAKVRAVVTNHGKDRKVTVFKYKRRKNYRRKQGHRQRFSVIRVEEIVGA